MGLNTKQNAKPATKTCPQNLNGTLSTARSANATVTQLARSPKKKLTTKPSLNISATLVQILLKARLKGSTKAETANGATTVISETLETLESVNLVVATAALKCAMKRMVLATVKQCGRKVKNAKVAKPTIKDKLTKGSGQTLPGTLLVSKT